jgi:hypothetical protein
LARVVDDYHLIDSQAVHDSVGFLLAHLPPRLRLLAGQRPPLARLRPAASWRGGPIQLRDLCQQAVVPTPPSRFVSGTAAMVIVAVGGGVGRHRDHDQGAHRRAATAPGLSQVWHRRPGRCGDLRAWRVFGTVLG